MLLLPLAKVKRGFQKETTWSCTSFAINHCVFKETLHYSLEGLLLVSHCLGSNVIGNYFFHYPYVLVVIYSCSIFLMIPSPLLFTSVTLLNFLFLRGMHISISC